jgi:hypothetical protein
MKIPESVVINGVEYDVQLVADSIDAEEEYGRISFQSRVIRIQDVGDPMVNWQTFMHEVFHGISHHYGLKLDTTDKKHEAMDVLACVLVDTLARSDILDVDD